MKHSLCAFVSAVGVLVMSPLLADWPHPRGPEMNGTVEAAGTIDADGVHLEPAWSIPLGSGYSGIAIADDRAVTLFSDADGDWMAAFGVEDGKQAWRVRLGDPTRGHDGSDDGPLGSPVIAAGTTYAIGADGKLFAVRLSDGKSLWTTSIADEFDADPPFFGFTTTPVVAEGTVIVQTGNDKGQSIVGLDARDGSKRWAYGDGKVQYQSPAVMTLGGRSQVVAISPGSITGLAPRDGEALWVHELSEDDRVGNTRPSFAGDDRFLFAVGGDVAMMQVRKGADGFTVEEVFRTDALGGNYAPPVVHDGHLYGFRGQILTCADAATGERVWRSRPPGGDGLILVDGHLVIFGAKGNVVVARATPDGYDERARIQALEGSSLTWPSFDAGRVFVRNLDRMAAVTIKAGTGAASAGAGAAAHEFGRWIAALERDDDPAARIDTLFASHDSMPIVEGEYIHFVFRGEADDVSIAGSMNDSESPEPMTRVPGADLFYRSVRLEPGGRWEYRFQVDYEDWKTDPNNSRSVPVMEGEGMNSEVVTDGYVMHDFLEETTGKPGRIEEFTLASEVLGYDKTVKVWLPPGYDDAKTARYALLVVNDGDAWLEKGRMATALDNLVGHGVRPVVVAFVEAQRRWWLEAGGSRTDDYLAMQVDELLPALAERYRLEDGASSRAVLGNQFFGLSTAYLALKHPDVFGGAAIQSAFLGLGAGDALRERIASTNPRAVRVYLDWNRYDARNIDRGYDFGRDSRALDAALREAGFAVSGGEVLDSYGWGGWRNRIGMMLAALFPADKEVGAAADRRD